MATHQRLYSPLRGDEIKELFKVDFTVLIVVH